MKLLWKVIEFGEVLGNFQEKSVIMGGTLWWDKIFSNYMPRITQELISRYFMKREVSGSLVKG